MKNKRISDQVLILQSITIVRDELKCAETADPRVIGEIMERLVSLYACLNPTKIVEVLKQADVRSKHGK